MFFANSVKPGSLINDSIDRFLSTPTKYPTDGSQPDSEQLDALDPASPLHQESFDEVTKIEVALKAPAVSCVHVFYSEQ